MQPILDIIVPVFGVVAIGYLATFTPVFDDAASRGLAAFVFNFALPIALFRAMIGSSAPLHTPFGFLAAYYGGTALMFVPALLIGGGGGDRRTILGFGCAYSNTVLLGIPLVIAALGREASVPLLLLISFHSAIFFTLVTALIEFYRGVGGGLRRMPLRLAQSLASNVVLMSLAAGILFHALQLTLPRPIDQLTEYLARAAFPGALFAMGAALRRYRLAGALGPAAAVTLAKLIVHPAIVALLATQFFSMPPIWAHTAILCAALPVGVNVYLFAVRYNIAEAEVASAILLSSLLSVVSVTLLLKLGGYGPPSPIAAAGVAGAQSATAAAPH